MFQCLFCPASSTRVQASKAPVLEIMVDNDDDDDLIQSKKNTHHHHHHHYDDDDDAEIPDIIKSNSTSTEETISCTEEEEDEEEHLSRVHEQNSLRVAMRTSTPSSQLEIFFDSHSIETVLSSVASPTSQTGQEEEDEDDDDENEKIPTLVSPSQNNEHTDDSVTISLGERPVLPASPSLDQLYISVQTESTGSLHVDSEEENEDQTRSIRIQQELDDILRHVDHVDFIMEDEAIEALGIAANQVAHINGNHTKVVSVGYAIVNGPLLEIAEDHYFGDSLSFVTRYAAVLRSAVKQMKKNALQQDKYYDGPHYEYVRPIRSPKKTMTTTPASRTQKLVSQLAQTVAWGSWKSAGWVIQKMTGPSSS
ncbi:MAG: hypothetical protein SGBAC_012410 [Bacillariaceae sp.]